MKSPLLRMAAVICALILLVGLAVWSLQRTSPPVKNTLSPIRVTRAAPAPVLLDVQKSVENAPLASVKTNPLFITAETRWEQPIAEEAFARFHDWADRYLEAPVENRAGLETEGLELARSRRAVLRDLIQSDPQRALGVAVPVAVREALPQAINELLEERINARGRLAVLGALAEPGKENEVIPIFRTAKFNEREFQAFVYGRRLGEPTRHRIPIDGIALDNLIAVNENP